MTGRQCASFFHCYGAAGTRKARWLTLEKTPMRKACSWKTERLSRSWFSPKRYIMKFSALMEILIKADMVTDAMVSTDCEIEDLNLMDRDYREFGDRIITSSTRRRWDRERRSHSVCSTKMFSPNTGWGDFGIQPASRKTHLWRKYSAM